MVLAVAVSFAIGSTEEKVPSKAPAWGIVRKGKDCTKLPKLWFVCLSPSY